MAILGSCHIRALQFPTHRHFGKTGKFSFTLKAATDRISPDEETCRQQQTNSVSDVTQRLLMKVLNKDVFLTPVVVKQPHSDCHTSLKSSYSVFVSGEI